ncbi:DUF6204 family protein [Streptomyces atriruber]|uniref:DUF6204 family protein n=1 Tax=Streptomyces atriruber TaxID=545121 RepID=UPI0006E17364|nr:DUF6204 family protein [Streptomyces atriruber]
MVTQHTYRVIVRGRWDALTDASRTALLADVEEHGLANMQFTPEGTLTYDRALQHFSYRFVVRSDAADGEEMAEALAEEKAESILKDVGHGFRDLRSKATDMDTMKINRKPSRR